MAKSKQPTGHRKPAPERRDDKIPVRVTPVERAMLTAGARHASVEVSTWMRLLAIQRCRELGFTEDTVTLPGDEPAAAGTRPNAVAGPAGRPKSPRPPGQAPASAPPEERSRARSPSRGAG